MGGVLMPRRIKPREAEELARLQKEKRRKGLGPIKGARLRKLEKKINRGLWGVVEDIHKGG